MRGATCHLDLEPREPAVRDDERQLGRLGDDRRVGVDNFQDLLDADTRVLLVGDGREDDVACQAEGGRLATGDERRGDARLHVVRAASVEPVALDPWAVRVVHPLDVDRVEVPAEQQGASASGAVCVDDDARPPGRRLEHVGLETRIPRPRRDERRDLRLARAAGDERRVDRVDRDQLRDQVCQIVGHARQSCPFGLWCRVRPTPFVNMA